MQVPTMWNAARTSIARALSFQIHSDSAPTFVPSNPECMSPSSSPLSAGDDVCGEEKSLLDFLRLKRGVVGGDGFELQTAIVSYGKRLQPNSIQVDLVAATHVAEKQYYKILQRELESYDCVLYELIKDREIPEDDRMNSKATRGPRSRFQRFDRYIFTHKLTALVLSLHFQLDCLDYEHENWQNADLDYETFELLQREKGEGFCGRLKETIRAQPSSLPSNLSPRISKPLVASPMVSDGYATSLRSITSPYGAMKIFFAKQMTSRSTKEFISAIQEKSVIIGERNRVAIEALRKAMDNGHRRIALFYGAAHMPDLERRLREEFDMVPDQVRWVTAWSIRRRETVSWAFLHKTLAKYFGCLLKKCQTFLYAAAPFVFGFILGTSIHWFTAASSETKIATTS